MKKISIIIFFILAVLLPQKAFGGNPGVIWVCSKGLGAESLDVPCEQLNSAYSMFNFLLTTYTTNQGTIIKLI